MCRQHHALFHLCFRWKEKIKKLNLEKKNNKTKQTKKKTKNNCPFHNTQANRWSDLLRGNYGLGNVAWHGKQKIHRCWFLSLFYTLQYEFQPLWIIYVCVAYMYLYNEMFKRKKKRQHLFSDRRGKEMAGAVVKTKWDVETETTPCPVLTFSL